MVLHLVNKATHYKTCIQEYYKNNFDMVGPPEITISIWGSNFSNLKLFSMGVMIKVHMKWIMFY